MRHLESQPGLAHPAGPGQGYLPNPGGQLRHDQLGKVSTADQVGKRERQRVGAHLRRSRT